MKSPMIESIIVMYNWSVAPASLLLANQTVSFSIITICKRIGRVTTVHSVFAHSFFMPQRCYMMHMQAGEPDSPPPACNGVVSSVHGVHTLPKAHFERQMGEGA
ncbi:hypothetical protein BO99DRAFT_27148 [Aspergillus violaceofuscus CBS 115571]|uniref:Uncharacterized protein n=1 Tax=Aspergillus violaceofuscus (strain CBS 115571) TaxID=1450538 RepID=A0A2V5H0M1_ASPV1|nr:hypothetical protein BO99DRAFT_27148 [Aspergillus violaceofuscus CBS 115571]